MHTNEVYDTRIITNNTPICNMFWLSKTYSGFVKLLPQKDFADIQIQIEVTCAYHEVTWRKEKHTLSPVINICNRILSFYSFNDYMQACTLLYGAQ